VSGGRPFLIGLTGNIATGKSVLARMLEALGARTIDADKVAHQVMAPGGPAYAVVVNAFGSQIVADDGTIDRGKLADIVFRDPDALRRLEAIVHPPTVAEVERRIAEARASVVLVEAIKLIEAGMHRAYDELWVVMAPRWLQIERLMMHRDMSKGEATRRVDAQSPQEEKAALADRVFVNDGSLDDLRREVVAAWEEIAPV
jgi:dephospho-CoA kinase